MDVAAKSTLSPSCWPTWIGLGLLRLFEPLPYRCLMALGAGLGALIGLLPLRYVRIARRNLELCFPQLDVASREALLKGHFRSLGQALFETALSWWSSDRRILRLTQVEGLEHLQAALARGQGAILLSAHFTTLEIGGRAICARVPKVNVMYRPSKNPVLAWFFARNRGRHAYRAIPRDDIRTLVSALSANEAVWYAPDQSYRKKGAERVPFFGIPAPTNTATSRLAKMTGAAVLPYFPERLKEGGYRMTIHPPLEHFPGEDRIADAVRIHALIEAHARRVPEQYLWIHRRFKPLTQGDPDYYSNK